MASDQLIITSGQGDGTNWGLASLLIGCTFILMAPLLLIVSIQMAAYGPATLNMNPTTIDLAATGMYLGIAVGGFVIVCSIIFGILGIALARSQGRSVALGVAGLFASIFGLVVIVVAVVDLIMVMDMFKQAGGHMGFQ